MFTGIVQAQGSVVAVEPLGGDVRLRVDAGSLSLAGVAVGESIAVAGACLTVTELDTPVFAADVSRETLACTTLGRLGPGAAVNLERSLTPSSPLGGHIVTGHVDGIGTVVTRQRDARSVRLRFEVPSPISRYIAAKGSVCVDGVSLTVNEVEGRAFGVNVIPHTASVTTIGTLAEGDAVNVEVDLMARYAERLLGAAP